MLFKLVVKSVFPLARKKTNYVTDNQTCTTVKEISYYTTEK